MKTLSLLAILVVTASILIPSVFGDVDKCVKCQGVNKGRSSGDMTWMKAGFGRSTEEIQTKVFEEVKNSKNCDNYKKDDPAYVMDCREIDDGEEYVCVQTEKGNGCWPKSFFNGEKCKVVQIGKVCSCDTDMCNSGNGKSNSNVLWRPSFGGLVMIGWILYMQFY